MSTHIPDGGLRLTITLQMADDGHPLVVEYADVGDIFDVVHELDHVVGVRFRNKLNDAALINLRRLNPPSDPPPDPGATAIIVKGQ